MILKVNSNSISKGSCSFYYRGVFSGLFNEKMGTAFSSHYSASDKEENSPSLSHIPERSLHFILYYLTIQQIKNSKLPSSYPRISYKPNRYFLFQYHKNFRLIRRLKGSALCLLQTQYAKKPKNPV